MMLTREKGFALVAVIPIVIIFFIVGLVVLTLAEQEIILGRVEVSKRKAFYLAEAGLAKMREQLQAPAVGEVNDFLEGSLETGTYSVILKIENNRLYVESTGYSGNVSKTIRAKVIYLAPPFEYSIYARNTGASDWSFQLRGEGDPDFTYPNVEKGGRDIIRGNIFVAGDAYFFDESSVNPGPAPNRWNLAGDVEATGSIFVDWDDGAYVSGVRHPYSEDPNRANIVAMDYEKNNTHNVGQIFEDAGVGGSGYLPSGHELRDVFVKNPSDRWGENASTPGVDDYYLEPSTGFEEGGYNNALTPIDVGYGRVYYIDGNLWVHSRNDTFGFTMEGKVTIVVTGDIHICDNLEYADAASGLGLVAAGEYDDNGNLESGGNIYFGDPAYGTMYLFSAMMYASNDFLYNTSSVSGQYMEPKTGFTCYGTFAAMERVSVERDWYTKRYGYYYSQARAARYNPETGQWVDSVDADNGIVTVLNDQEIGSLRHYQMIVNYDEKVRNASTQPPLLPRGTSDIFCGFTDWEEL